MHRINFKFRLLLSFLAVSIIPFILSWTFINNTYDKKMEQDFKNFNYMYVQNQMAKIEHFFTQKETEIKSIAQSFSHLDINDTNLYAFLRDQKTINQLYMNLYIIMPDGSVYTDELGYIPREIDYTRLHSYIFAKKFQELVWLEPYTDVVSGNQCLGMSIPLLDKSGKPSGVLVGNISLKTFGNMLINAKYNSREEMFFINPDGYVKFHSGNKYSESVNIMDNSFILHPVSDALSQLEEGYREFSYNGRDWACSFSLISSNGWKAVSLMRTDEMKNIYSTMNQDTHKVILLLSFVCCLSGLLASLFLFRSVSSPLMELRKGVMAIAAGDLDSRIHMNRNDEIKEVADAFNKMAASLKYTYTNLLKRTEELYTNNKELQSANMQLEASYEQLEATMGQLNESEEKYRTMMNNISDMVLVVNKDDNIVYINNSVEKILGYKEEDLLGKPVINIVKHRYPGFLELANNARDYREFEGNFMKSDGSLIQVEGSTKKVIEDDRVVGIQAIVRDVTQKKAMELQLRRKYEELQTLNRISNTLASTMDLNNMLAIVINHVAEVSQALACAIRLVSDKDPYILELKALKGIRTERYDRSNIDIRQDITGQVFEKKEAIVYDIDCDSLSNDYYKSLYKNNGARYIVITPIMVKAKVIGVLCTTLEDKPRKELVELIRSLANNVAIAIDNARAYETLKHSYLKTVQSLVSVVEAKDLYTESHSIRVAKYSAFIATEMNFSKEFVEDIWVAGVLHDIGKIGISDSILNKAGPLTEDEYNAIKQHPDIAYRIVSKIGLSENILMTIRHHHERYDGKGYPDMIGGEDIPIMVAIISVSDAFDAITSNRPYRKSRSLSQGINEIVSNRGTQFNPFVVQAFETAYLLKREVFQKIYNDEEIEFF